MPSNSLEQEAMDRVKRMYSSFDRPRQNVPFKRPAEPINPPKRPTEPLHPSKSAEHEPKPQPVPPKESVHREQSRGFLELLMKDKDQSLILLLLVILMKDGADMNLLVALVYMLI